MIEQYAKADELSCLLSLQHDSEILPEPFRLQRSALFRVTFSVYRDYILSLPDDTVVKLPQEVSALRDAVASNQSVAFCQFLKSMAFAIVKELYFAERHNAVAATILPASNRDDAVVMNYSNLHDIFSSLTGASGNLLKEAREKDWAIHSNVMLENQRLFEAAVVFNYWADSETVSSEFHIVYDL